jgi:hypothetical protein
MRGLMIYPHPVLVTAPENECRHRAHLCLCSALARTSSATMIGFSTTAATRVFSRTLFLSNQRHRPQSRNPGTYWNQNARLELVHPHTYFMVLLHTQQTVKVWARGIQYPISSCFVTVLSRFVVDLPSSILSVLNCCQSCTSRRLGEISTYSSRELT